MKGFEAHLSQVKEVLEAKIHQVFTNSERRCVAEKVNMQQTQQTLSETSTKYCDEFLSSQRNLTEALQIGEQNKKCLELINNTVLDITRRARTNIPKNVLHQKPCRLARI
jgi:hypothetical protein